MNFYHIYQPASVAQLDVHPTGDQQVAVLTPAGSATFVCGVDHEIFSNVILSLLLIQDGSVVSSWQKNVHNTG